MVIKCLSCGAAVEYDPLSEKMKCKYCNSMFDVKEFSQKEELENETMECDIYSCTSCGAELAVNGVEASTFCAYCGQPTIVFNRVSHEMKPKLIIPFKIPREYAIYAIRQRFAEGRFIPKEVKNFDVERVCGIYIPYWLFDTYYYDRQIIKARVKYGKSDITVRYLREADCNFKNLSLDASFDLSDDSTQRLEPYNMDELRKFEAGYMSGFYADRYDMKNIDLHDLLFSRSKEMFDNEVLETCEGHSKKIVSNGPKMQIQKETYVMLPAWFMTFRYKNRPYTMLVNGQTGKLVGAVPFDKKKACLNGIGIFLLLACLCVPIFHKIFLSCSTKPNYVLTILFIVIMLIILIFKSGISKIKSIKDSTRLTSSLQTNHFANDRQEGQK